MTGIDTQVDEWAESLRGRPLADRLFYAASEWGDWSKIWHVFGAAQAVARRDPPSPSG